VITVWCIDEVIYFNWGVNVQAGLLQASGVCIGSNPIRCSGIWKLGGRGNRFPRSSGDFSLTTALSISQLVHLTLSSFLGTKNFDVAAANSLCETMVHSFGLVRKIGAYLKDKFPAWFVW